MGWANAEPEQDAGWIYGTNTSKCIDPFGVQTGVAGLRLWWVIAEIHRVMASAAFAWRADWHEQRRWRRFGHGAVDFIQA